MKKYLLLYVYDYVLFWKCRNKNKQTKQTSHIQIKRQFGSGIWEFCHAWLKTNRLFQLLPFKQNFPGILCKAVQFMCIISVSLLHMWSKKINIETVLTYDV